MSDNYQGLVEKYRQYLPIGPDVQAVSLLEGNTPLIHLQNMPNDLQVYVKFEGLNPTGSFKDRGMTVAVTHAVASGAKAVICASTGNTSASAAAYAARAGIKSFVIIPAGKIAQGKLAQAMMHGAHILQIDGDFDLAMSIVKTMQDHLSIAIVNSINPYRLQGQKTAAFEIIEQLGRAPDIHALPVGNAGNISAYWMGYREYKQVGISQTTPMMLGYQAAGAAPFIHQQPIQQPETVATAIRIGNPQSYDKAWQAVDQSQGWFRAVTDEEILNAQRELAQQHGVFCEPASAASYAGLKQDIHDGKIQVASTVVLTLTGHGLKDPDIAIKLASDNCHTVAADEYEIKTLIEKLM